MTRAIHCIVEGDGEVHSVPALLRRMAHGMNVFDVDVPRPHRVRRDQFLNRPDEFTRVVRLVSGKARQSPVLILLDADDDCPVNLAAHIRDRVMQCASGTSCHVVLAKCEFEAWFIAAAESIAGKRGLREDLTAPGQPDDIRSAKEWLRDAMPRGRKYHEVSDQPALTEVFDLQLAARRSRSFRKFVGTVQSMVMGGRSHPG